MKFNLITILGPTAVGKTRLGALLAAKFNGEIISADSRQVYKGMNIGTGKDFADYLVNGKQIKYHLIDIIHPSEEFNLFLFKKYFFEALDDINSRNKFPFLVGGTGLYLSAILQNYQLPPVNFEIEEFKAMQQLSLKELREILFGLNPRQHNKTDLLYKDRIIKAILIEKANAETNTSPSPINSLVIGVKAEREIIKERITKRLTARLDSGMIEEVKTLIEQGISHDRLCQLGLEYKFISLYLQNKLIYNEMYQKLNSAIHSFAKRQMTWFRKMEREGIKINWIESGNYQDASNLIETIFSSDR
jgi:tRNA dimethylallyltransferase